MAGTDKSIDIVYRPSPAIILVEPQLGENIGSTARAMANFGLWDLRLVNPRDGWPNGRAIAAASRADHVIDKVRVFETLEAAIADLSLVYATTARGASCRRKCWGRTSPPSGWAPTSRPAAAPGCCSGASAGASTTRRWRSPTPSSRCRSRRRSLRSTSPRRCWCSPMSGGAIPTPRCPSAAASPEQASKEEMVRLFEHIEEALDRSGFFTVEDKRPHVVNNLRTMLSRGSFSSQEVRTLHGIIAAIDRRHERPNPYREKQKRDKEGRE